MKIQEFFRKVQFFVLLAIGTYPAVACIIIFVAPELLPYMWLFPAAFFALGLLSFAIPGKLRMGVGVLGAVLFILPCLLYLQSNARNIAVTFALGYSAMLLWSLRIPGWNPAQEIPTPWLGGCFAVVLAGCLLSHYEPRLVSVAVWIKASLFVYVFFAMLSLNRGSMRLASGGRQGFSQAMRQKNVLLTVAMFAIAIAVALIPSLYNLVKLLFGWIGALIQSIAELFPEQTLATQTTAETTQAASTGEGMEALFEGLETNRTPQAVYIMMAVIALGVMIPVGGYALYKLGKLVVYGVKKLVTGMVVGASLQAEDFVDEITDTRADAQAEYYRETGEKAAGQRTAVGMMLPAEQIRYRYRRLAKKHPEWKLHMTARENLAEDAAQLYERARYSDHPVTQQDAEQFKNKTK